MKHAIESRLGLIGIAAVMFGAAAAADTLPKTHVTAVGNASKTVNSYKAEAPFWAEVIPNESGGSVTANFTPYDLLGIAGTQILRLTNAGVVDFGAGDFSKIAGDNPIFEGCDLAGLSLDIETVRAACEAWLPVVSPVAEQLFNTKFLGTGTNPPQVIWCRGPVGGLVDMKGKKVRVFNKSMTDFLEAVGATPVPMSFSEVVPSMQRGVIDCAVTGTMSGFTAGWPEVATHQFQLFMGWSVQYQSVNIDSWERFGPDLQAFFSERFDGLTDQLWKVAKEATIAADACNFGEGGACPEGTVAQLVNVPVTDADREAHRQVMTDVVLVKWGQRVGKDVAQKWNETVGKVVGFTIPLHKI